VTGVAVQSFIGAWNLSPVTYLVAGTGAVSRLPRANVVSNGGTKLSRRQKLVKVQDFNCVQMRVFWCKSHYKFVLRAGAKVEERSDEIPRWRGKKCDKQLTHSIVRVIARYYSSFIANFKVKYFLISGKNDSMYGYSFRLFSYSTSN
jgi:hypothetical protein